jgi:hypothetical protein
LEREDAIELLDAALEADDEDDSEDNNDTTPTEAAVEPQASTTVNAGYYPGMYGHSMLSFTSYFPYLQNTYRLGRVDFESRVRPVRQVQHLVLRLRNPKQLQYTIVQRRRNRTPTSVGDSSSK